jgi:hypothetical protein
MILMLKDMAVVHERDSWRCGFVEANENLGPIFHQNDVLASMSGARGENF